MFPPLQLLGLPAGHIPSITTLQIPPAGFITTFYEGWAQYEEVIGLPEEFFKEEIMVDKKYKVIDEWEGKILEVEVSQDITKKERVRVDILNMDIEMLQREINRNQVELEEKRALLEIINEMEEKEEEK